MKKLIFVNCILALAVIFTYCAKPDLKQELSESTDAVAGNRTPCTLVAGPGSVNTVITLCGTNTNTTRCVGCPSAATTQGVEVYQGSAFSLLLQAPITFSISNTNATTLNLTVDNQLAPIPVGANECHTFHIDANCIITQIN